MMMSDDDEVLKIMEESNLPFLTLADATELVETLGALGLKLEIIKLFGDDRYVVRTALDS